MDKKLKVLILDDVATDAELMKQELSKEQFEFVSNVVSTEEDFLNALKKFKPDLILSDYSLPQFDGLAALEIAKKLAPMTPFIIVTGKLSEETAVDCIKAGAWDYVIKERLVRLGPAVKNALELKKEKTERKLAEQKIQKELGEKEILLKEIHHRVKNNLQVICSLLLLQSRYIKDKKALDMFQESQDRVRSMALVHEKLYRSKDLSSIDFADYVRSLANNIYRSYRANPEKIRLKIQVETLTLSIEKAVPCGLLINEIISNSFKYAFLESHSGKGEIQIKLASKGKEQVILMVKDNGVGLAPGFDIEKIDSLGMRLINILGKDQLAGEMKLDTTNGTKYQFIFKKS